jgi:alanine-synthesizing transaminase
VVRGPHAERSRALAALEIIADTFLSVGTPVQAAASALLARGEIVRNQIRRRLDANLSHARELGRHRPACTLLPVEGGWSLVVRVPAVRSEEMLALELLEHEKVLVHPGYFFDFRHEAYIVVSLLPPEDQFRDAFVRTLALASTAPSPSTTHKR